MRNAGVEEAQAEIKIAGRNINNLRYADDTTLMAESEEELKSLLMKVKEDQMANTKIRLIILFAAKDGEGLYNQKKTRPGADCGSDHELLIA